MTKEEFIKWDNYFKKRADKFYDEIRQADKIRNEIRGRYVVESFEKYPLKKGSRYTDGDGKAWYVAGAFLNHNNEVQVMFNFAKKDGAMSKISGLGRGMPRVIIG